MNFLSAILKFPNHIFKKIWYTDNSKIATQVYKLIKNAAKLFFFAQLLNNMNRKDMPTVRFSSLKLKKKIKFFMRNETFV